MTNTAPDLRGIASSSAESTAPILSKSATRTPAQPAAEAGADFDLRYNTATIACGCGALIEAWITSCGTYAPSDGLNYADQSEPAEIDCAPECPKCGADFSDAIERTCLAIYRAAHGRGR